MRNTKFSEFDHHFRLQVPNNLIPSRWRLPFSTYHRAMLETLSIKISSADKARLKALSEARNIPISALVREGLKKCVVRD